MDIDNVHSLSRVRHVVGVASGKGGVGKSTLALLLALSLKKLGWRIGLMDADIYGPSLRKMLPEEQLPEKDSQKIYPALCQGISLISMAYFLREGDCASVRAPIANGFIKQFIHTVEWGELDCLLIDFPPGTGDIQLTLMQEARLSGVVVITTPQEVALLDVDKAVAMFRQMQIPIFGLVENMSYFCAGGEKAYPFGKEGGKVYARENGLYFLGDIPLDAAIASACDQGVSLLEVAPSSAGALSFESICLRLIDQLNAFESLEKRGVKQFDLHWEQTN